MTPIRVVQTPEQESAADEQHVLALADRLEEGQCASAWIIPREESIYLAVVGCVGAKGSDIEETTETMVSTVCRIAEELLDWAEAVATRSSGGRVENRPVVLLRPGAKA